MPESEYQPIRPPADPTGQIFVAADDAPVAGDDDANTDGAPRTSALRTATVVSGRLVLGFVVLGVIAVVVAAASLIPLPTVHSRAGSTVVTPVPTVQQLVCPGGLLRIGSVSGAGATTASAIGAPQVTSSALSGVVIPSTIPTSDAHDGAGAAAPRLLATPSVAAGAPVPRLAGAQSETIATSEFAGLASAACEAASGGTWLAGGATSTGRTTLLLLTNPTAVSATVSIHIFGETGPVTAPGTEGIVVGAGAQRVLSLAGFAPGLVSPVVHVTSTGGQVLATLEQSTVRGLVPGGIDFVGGQAQPTVQAVIPGVVVSGTSVIQGDIGQSGFEDLQSTLRVFVPGSANATVSVTVIAENGTVTGKPTTAQVPAGDVADLALDSLSDGMYTVVVSSKTPVVASVRVSTAGSSAVSGSTDFAWATAAPLLTSPAMVSVASNMAAAIHLENPTGVTQTVRLHAIDGFSLTATVKAHSATAVPVVAGTTYELENFTSLYASVSGTTDGGVTSYVVSPSARGQGPLRVYG